MRALIITIALAALCAGCAGLTANTQHNEMFLTGDEGEAAPAIRFGPGAAALENLPPEDRTMVLMEYARAAGQWLTFAPSWTQTIGSTIDTEGEIRARLKAMLAKEIGGDQAGGGDENVPEEGP